ncbi:MAG: sigma-54-dependent Fis family transcriptional regulator [Desulfuromonadaceae bacterium]|nr:sigma-54-dependent Fis family transcriptional regulator [Desulfuromonadaceae bacterium]
MNDSVRILIIDDEASLRHLLTTILTDDGYRCDEAADGKTALTKLAMEHYDLILSDIRMPGMDGLALMEQALKRDSTLALVMMSAYGSIDTAIDCVKQGAYDYIAKPFRPDDLLLTVKKALERRRLQHENQRLRRKLQQRDERTIISSDPAMQEILTKVDRLAAVASPVLICGETGTGKELIARALHARGPRTAKPFVPVNCSAISPSLIESELFGHAKGAFTGADRSRPGLFSAADGGTLFLDEIGELPLEVQPKLLRVLQENEIRPVGETRTQPVDVRIVTATARDLKQAVADGTFREDLYYRLAVVELDVPPLRRRPDDIAQLSQHFLSRIARREHRTTPQLTERALGCLQHHPWAGNVRELENLMEKIMIFHHAPLLDCPDLPPELSRSGGPCPSARPIVSEDLSLKKAVAQLERHHILAALERCDGNRTQAAKLLEISLRALHYKIREYGL